MKKTIFSVMFAMILGMVVCSCNNAATPAGAEVDSTLVDSIATVDSVIADSLGQVVVDSVCAE